MSAPREPRGRGLLPALPVDVARAALSPPRVPEESLPSVALAREAAAMVVPVRLEAAPAAGRMLLARALHAASARAGPLLVVDGRCRSLHGLPAGASVVVDVETLSIPAAALLESLLDDGTAWLLVATPPGYVMSPALAPRIDAITVRIPPLRERVAELPGLAAHLVAALCGRRGVAAPPLGAEAVAHLAAQPWPGDLAELEAALARALLRAGNGPISVHHLTGADGSGARPPVAGPDVAGVHLEYLVTELAHELRNPLSTLKTYAHLPALPDDAGLRARFAILADDAIARMDGVLENVLAFARMAAPVPTALEVGPVLDALVAEIRPVLAERAVPLEYAAANGARCTADREQLAYALRNLFAAVAREAPPHDTLRIDAAAPGVVRVAFSDRNCAADRLRRLVLADRGLDPDDRTLLPLSFTLARAVLARNGGGLTMRTEPDGRTTLDVRLPGAGVVLQAPEAGGREATGPPQGG